MPIIYYKRASVPVGGHIRLETRFRDSGGNLRDTDSYPSVEILDNDGGSVRAPSNAEVQRLADGHYRLDFEVPPGFTEGVWHDQWTAAVDGYAAIARFDFVVDSSVTAEATGETVGSPEMRIGDEPTITFNQQEIFGINVLMQALRFRLKNTQRKPDGSRCDIFSIGEMASFLNLALSEFNATPTFTGYYFSDPLIYTIFSDLLVEGAYLKALPSLVPVEAGREWVVTDNGISIQPASVSGALNNVMSSLYNEYRAKLKEAKRNHRPSPLGMGAGSILVTNPVYRRLRQIKLNQY